MRSSSPSVGPTDSLLTIVTSPATSANDARILATSSLLIGAVRTAMSWPSASCTTAVGNPACSTCARAVATDRSWLLA